MFHYSDYYNIFDKQNCIDYFLVRIDNEKLVINTQLAYEKERENNEKLNQKLLKVSSDRNINKKMKKERIKMISKSSKVFDYINNTNNIELQDINNEKIYCAGALVIKWQDQITILVSGYDKKYKDFAPNYFLYYEILMYYKNKYKYACLNGISGDFSKESKYQGLNNFKLGFAPDIYEYIGEFDLILNKINYYFLNKKNLILQ